MSFKNKEWSKFHPLFGLVLIIYKWKKKIQKCSIQPLYVRKDFSNILIQICFTVEIS